MPPRPVEIIMARNTSSPIFDFKLYSPNPTKSVIKTLQITDVMQDQAVLPPAGCVLFVAGGPMAVAVVDMAGVDARVIC